MELYNVQFPDSFNPDNCLPTREDIEQVNQARLQNDAWELQRHIQGEDFCYDLVRYFLVTVAFNYNQLRYVLLKDMQSNSYKKQSLVYSDAQVRAIVMYARENMNKWYKQDYTKAEVSKESQFEDDLVGDKLKAQRSEYGKITYKVKNTGYFFRIIPTDLRHISGVLRRWYFGKKLSNGKFNIVFLGTLKNPAVQLDDCVYYKTAEDAAEAIKNVNNIQANHPLTCYKYTITDKPIEGYSPQTLDEVILVDTVCGPAYMSKQSRKSGLLKESVTEDINLDEAAEKHETLNPRLWNTEDNTLKPEVTEKINLIVQEFAEGFTKAGIPLNIKDIVLVGSNCSYNYTDYSDLDIHIRVDLSDTETEQQEQVLTALYDAYKKIWNSKYSIDFYGIPVELYIETKFDNLAEDWHLLEAQEMPLVSNGIYSVLNNAWIKEPVAEEIPDIDNNKLDNLVREWEERYMTLINDTNTILKEAKVSDHKVEHLPDVNYKGFTIVHFPLECHIGDKVTYTESWIINSPYYLQSTPDQPKYYLPLFAENEYGDVVDFNTLEEAKEYIDDYIITKKGKIRVWAPHGGSDECHFELLPEYRKEHDMENNELIESEDLTDDGLVKCEWCGEMDEKSDCKYDKTFGWLCPTCQAYLPTKGEHLHFIEPPEELTEKFDSYEAGEKMYKLETGVRGFNATSATDEKILGNMNVCWEYGYLNALRTVEAEALRRDLIKAKTDPRQRLLDDTKKGATYMQNVIKSYVNKAKQIEQQDDANAAAMLADYLPTFGLRETFNLYWTYLMFIILVAMNSKYAKIFMHSIIDCFAKYSVDTDFIKELINNAKSKPEFIGGIVQAINELKDKENA